MFERKMDREPFNRFLDELDGNSVETLKEKNARYSSNDDALHNFRSGAEIFGGTPAKACWGYASKHMIALRDMIDRNDFSNREDFLEKCQDTINYIRFIWCIGNDEEYWKAKERPNVISETVTVYYNGKIADRYDNVNTVISDEDGFVIYFVDGSMPCAYNYDIGDYTYKITNRKDK